MLQFSLFSVVRSDQQHQDVWLHHLTDFPSPGHRHLSLLQVTKSYSLDKSPLDTTEIKNLLQQGIYDMAGLVQKSPFLPKDI